MSYRNIDADRLRQQYGFKVCRTISYFLTGVGLSRLLAYLGMVPSFRWLAIAALMVWFVLFGLMALSIGMNLKAERYWHEGINPSRFVLLCCVGIVAIAGLGLELYRIGG